MGGERDLSDTGRSAKRVLRVTQTDLFVGIDSGGTKIETIISKPDGDVIGFARGPGGIPRRVTMEEYSHRLRAVLEAAVALPGPDFEDNVQIACAKFADLDIIVTRNVADFRHASLPVVETTAIVDYLSS